MAASILQALIAQAGLAERMDATSAGLFAVVGQPISQGARESLSRRGIASPAGGARPLLSEAVQSANLILTMSWAHKELVIERFPQTVGRVYTLREYAYEADTQDGAAGHLGRLWADEMSARAMAGDYTHWSDPSRQREIEQAEQDLPDLDIPDPFGSSDAVYEEAARTIEQACKAALARILREHPDL
jgi:protein-tyrosine-phosphatase